MPKIGRNQPCYCGSGKKFKKCHGKGVDTQTAAGKDRVTRLPDGSLRISTNVPLDQLGPPFGYKELIIVPQFDERDMKPNERQPGPAGKPGEYDVTFVFARPELSLVEIREADLDFINGDSTLVIASPEPRVKGQPSGIKMDVEYTTEDGQKRSCAFMLRPNKHGRLSIALTTLSASGHRDARQNAYRALLPFLSKISFEHNTPVEIKACVTLEKSTGAQNMEFKVPFPFTNFHILSAGLHSQYILALLSFYREGMNSTSVSYSFLCFYRVIEAIYKKRNELAQGKKVRYLYTRENKITEQDLMGLPQHMDSYREFVGKKFQNIYETDLTSLRIKIAHGLLGDENPFENTPDDLTMRNRVNYLTPVAQILARLEVQNELTKKIAPQGNKEEGPQK
jgi:hypothetical protein